MGKLTRAAVAVCAIFAVLPAATSASARVLPGRVDLLRAKVHVAVGANPQGIAIAPDGKLAYVANQSDDSLSVIDLASQKVLTTWATGGGPDTVAVSPDSKTVYVSNSTSSPGSVSVFDAATGLERSGSPVEVGNQPLGLALTPDGKQLVVATSDQGGSVAIVDTTRLSDPKAVTRLGGGVDGANFDSVAINATGTLAYVTDGVGGWVTVFSLGASPARLQSVNVASAALGVELTADGKTLYVVDPVNSQLVAVQLNGSGLMAVDGIGAIVPSTVTTTPTGIGPTDVHRVDGTPYLAVVAASDGSLQFFNTGTATIDKTIQVGSDADSVAVFPTSTKLLVTNPSDGEVAVVDRNAQAATGYAVGNRPVDIAVGSNGYAYVLNQDDQSVSYLNLNTGQVARIVYVGNLPQSIVLSADGRLLYVANAGDYTITVLAASPTVAKVVCVLGDSSPTADVDPPIDSPYGMAISSDGKTLYVANNGSATVTAYDVSAIAAADLSKANLGLVAPPKGSPLMLSTDGSAGGPTGLVLSPDGTKLYVADSQTDGITVIDLATGNPTVWTPSFDPEVGLAPFALAISPDGKTLYSANDANDTISAISTATGTDVKGSPVALPAGSSPAGLQVVGNNLAVSLNGLDGLALLDRSKLTAAPIIADVGTSPLAVAAAGTKILVVNNGDNTVSVLGAPGAPTAVSASAGQGGVLVSWTPSAISNGVAVDRYTVTSSPDGLTCTASGSATSCTVTGLKASTTYTFTVKASSALGVSDASAPSSPFTTPGRPDAPTAVTLTPQLGALQVTWTAPVNDGGSPITGYTATATGGAAKATCSAVAPATTCTIGGLSASYLYTVSVLATNAVGDSPASASATGSPKLQTYPPAAPSNVKATARNQAVTVSWGVPADGGMPITGYSVQVFDGVGNVVASCSVTTTTCKISGLTNSTDYTVSVLATNANGSSPPSAAVAFRPTGPPAPPSNLRLVAGAGQLTASWDVAAADPLNPVTGYTVRLSPGGATCSSTGTSCTVAGLVNGTAYTATAVATNSAGDSPSSVPSAPATPADVPSAPAVPLLRASSGSVTGYWNAPASSNGSPVTGYTLSVYSAGSNPTLQGSCTTATRSCTVSGLVNGSSYVASVSATNAIGTGPSSASSTPVVAAGKPGNPALAGTRAANRSVTISWLAADANGSAVTGYAVSATDSQGNPAGTGCLGDANLRSCTVTGLVNGTAYTFTLSATNAVGTTTTSAGSLTPLTTPGSPTNLVVVPGNALITATWVAPVDNGGSAIASYTASAFGADGQLAATCSTPNDSSTSCALTGLSNGQRYTVSVVATSAAGSSAPSASSSPVNPATTPSAPVAVSTTPGSRSISVSWSAPTSDGGSPVAGYLVTATGAGSSTASCSAGAGATTCTITGLVNGSSYAISVVASNRVGSSPAASAGSATPLGAPGAPTVLAVSSADGTASVSWAAPADNGGSAITGYTATAYASSGSPVASCSAAGGDASCTVTGLVNATPYRFRVVATNAVGSSPASAPSAVVTPVAVQTVPTAPTAVAAAPGDASAVVTWQPPSSTGGPSLTGYTATAYGPSGAAAASCQTDGIASGCSITGLANATSYTVRVSAANPIGLGPEAPAPRAVVPQANLKVPGAPGGLRATAGANQVQLAWNAPTSTGGSVITSSTATAVGSDGSTGSCSAVGTTSTCTIYGLVNGVAYSLTVASANGVGSSPASTSISATPFTTPDAPLIASASPGSGSVLVVLNAPSFDGGSALKGYTVTASPGGKTCTASLPSFSCSVTGLTNGTEYAFTAQASNAAGLGTTSSPRTATPSTQAVVPLSPSSVSASPGNAAAVVTWQAPSDQGGTAVVATYAVRSSSGKTCTVAAPATSCNVVGLTNGTAVTFTVTATNAAGTSPASAPSASVTPATLPSAPDAPKVLAGDGQLTVYWNPPASNGGAPILYYVVVASLTDGSLSFCTVAATTCQVTGLTNGASYAVTVAATNVVGTGPSSASSSAAPVTVPDAPASISTLAAPQALAVTWSPPPANGGAAVTGYLATALRGDGSSAGNCSAGAGASTCLITGLANGTNYDVSVVASNRIGTGSAAFAAGKSVPVAPPTAPGSISASPGDGEISASWTAPADLGGLPLSGFLATAYPVDGSAAQTCRADAAAQQCTIGGLTNGTGYRVRVVASNLAGSSPDSAESATVAPQPTPTAPSIPLSVRASAGDGSVGISWQPPSSTGGPAIASYRATAWLLEGDGTRSFSGFCSTDGTARSCTITGLANAKTYATSVEAANRIGTSPLAAGPAVSPKAGARAPGSPTAVKLVAGPGRLAVTWTAPANDGGSSITGSTAVAVGVDGSSSSCVAVGPATSCSIDGLNNGVAYGVTVASANAMGSGSSSSVAKATPISAPSVPAVLAVSVGNGKLLVVLGAPASDGGSPVTGYTVTSSAGVGCSAVPPALSCTVSGLSNGTSYTFSASATNIAGTSPASDPSDPATPSALALAPSVPVAVEAEAGNASAQVSWSAADDQGGLATPATYTAKVVGQKGSCTVAAPATTCSITGLTNGTSYSFAVTAANAVGSSAASAASNAVTPATTPGPPVGVKATGRDAGLNVSWSAPSSNGGSAILGSNAVAVGADGTVGSCSATGEASSCTILGLSNGTSYSVKVSSANALGMGPESGVVLATPLTTPSAPTVQLASPGSGRALIFIAGPASDGGSTVTGYAVIAKPGGKTCSITVPATSCAITGLSNGTTYTFTATATNAAGTGPASAPSEPATPSASLLAPGAPTALTGVAGDGLVTLNWSAPGDQGGLATPATYTAKVVGQKGSCSVTAPATSCSILGLSNGTAYTFTVTAANAAGSGPASATSVPVSPFSPYVAPTPPAVLALLPVPRAVVVTLGAPDDDGGEPVTSSTVTVLDPSGLPVSSCVVAGPSGSCTADGLENGTTYAVVAFATNAVGNSPLAEATTTATPLDKPSAPEDVTARSGEQMVIAHWSPPSEDGGSPIIAYTATAYAPDGSAAGSCSTLGASATDCAVLNLTNGQSYSISVVATTAVGSSPGSLRSNVVVPAGLPGSPTGVALTQTPGALVVRWEPPRDSGGLALISSTATLRGGDGSTATCMASLVQTSCAATGLKLGVAYSASVIARNPVGYSAPSGSSPAVIAVDLPGAPTRVIGVGKDAAVEVSWQAPASNGGTPITGYRVQLSGADGKPVGAPCATSGTGSSCTVGGLGNGSASYTAVVTATNAMGSTDSSPSAPVTPIPASTVPGVPQSVTATSGPASVLVSWLPPASSGGPAIVSYVVCQSSPQGGCTQLPVASLRRDGEGRLSTSMGGLANGTAYRFTVAATNVLGAGVFSAPSAPVKPKAAIGASSPPVSVSAKLLEVPGYPNVVRVRITWSSPTSNGLSPIYFYQVSTQDIFGTNLGTGCSTSGLSCDVYLPMSQGSIYTPLAVLPPGSSVNFAVQAFNAAGPSDINDPAAQVKVQPQLPPQPPVLSLLLVSSPQRAVVYRYLSATGARMDNQTCRIWLTSFSTVVAESIGPCQPGYYTFPNLASTFGLVLHATVTAAGMTSAEATSTWLGPLSRLPRTTSSVPNAPTNVVASPGDGLATIGFDASDVSDGSPAPLFYRVTASPGGRSCISLTTSCSIEGLTNGRDYSFTVVAVGDGGNSEISVPSRAVTPYSPFTVPTAPSVTSTTAGNASILVSFTEPADDGGKPITGYVATASPGGRRCTVPAGQSLNCTITGLSNGTLYTVSVAAINALGSGQRASVRSLRPRPVAPAAPAQPTLVAADTAVTATWTAPDDNGGSTITGYSVSVLDPFGEPAGSCAVPATTTSCRVAGLANNVGYTANVKATNTAGTSEASASSLVATPVPANVQAIACAPGTSTCFAVGNLGAILWSNDSGMDWHRADSPLTTDLNAVACPTATHCIAVGAAGKVVETKNLSSWSLVAAPGKKALSGLACPTASSCVAVGFKGAVLTTADLVTWKKVKSGFKVPLAAVACPKAKTCIAVGAGATVLASKDAGATWTASTGASGTDLTGIACPTSKLCLAVGTNGYANAIKRSGSLVQPLPAMGARDVNAITCNAEGSCLAVGADGISYLTTNAGMMFTANGVGSSAKLLSVASSGSAFLVGGTTGLLTYSLSQGVLWTPAYYPT